MITFIKNNWELILSIMITIAGLTFNLYKFSKLPKDKQESKVRLWLLAKVTWAQKELGDNTGPLKRSIVYGLFICAFPKIALKMPLALFDTLLKAAIAEMDDILEKSENALKYVNDSKTYTEIK